VCFSFDLLVVQDVYFIDLLNVLIIIFTLLLIDGMTVIYFMTTIPHFSGHTILVGDLICLPDEFSNHLSHARDQ
jgi:hypothetical protein